jgi:signal transduction histidine kinase
MSNEFLSFLDAAEPQGPQAQAAPWKLAIIDDDQAVHDGTRFALKNFSLNGRKMELLGARSAREGLDLLRRHDDVAVVLLDVVMETEDAGLKLAQAIRRDLKNELVRIILRTGQPGQAPEHRIVVDYDINDYKAKTELTAEKLFTTLTSALRSYEQLKRLDDTRLGLEMIVAGSSELFSDRSLATLAHGVLIQLNALLGIDSAGMLVIREDGASDHTVLARIGSFADDGTAGLDFHALFGAAAGHGRPLHQEGLTHLYVRTSSGSEILVVLDGCSDMSEMQSSLVSVFSAKLAVAFDNARLHEQLRDANVVLEDRVRERTAELAAMNERLEAQSALLRRVNAFKNEMLGTVAHDLKNPLAVVLGRAEMLSTLAQSVDERVAKPLLTQIEHVRTAAQRMTRIVDVSVADALADALDISINERQTDLKSLVATAASMNGPLAEAKGQTLHVDLAEPLPVRCDPDRMAEAIDNLLSNAIKYTPAGGRIEVTGRREGSEALVSVSDSGPGLKPEDVARLFGRFQRLSAQPTGGESSTGLGLSIVQKIIDLHHGHVSVSENGPLGGARFTVALPIWEKKRT